MRRYIDVRVLLVILAGLFVVGAYWLAVSLAKDYYSDKAAASSVYDSSPQGLKLYFAYLKELDLQPKTVQDFDSLPSPRSTIIAAAPLEKQPTRAEQRRLAKWVRSGGRLVLVGAEARRLIGALELGGTAAYAPERTTMRPLLPAVYANGVGKVSIGGGRVLVDTPAWVTHLKDASGQVLVSQSVGRGEVAWLSDTYPLSNEGIDKLDDAALGVALAASRPEGIYFDEYHHGYVSRGGLWDRLGMNGQAALVLLVVALALGLFEASRRLGRPIPRPALPAARSGGGYIASLGELYRKAGAHSEALASLEEGLVRALVRRTGTLRAGEVRFPSAATALTESRAARERGELDRQTFIAMAARLRAARREVEG